MWPNSQFPADLVTFTEETLNGKLHFLCSETIQPIQNFLHTRGHCSKNEVFRKRFLKLMWPNPLSLSITAENIRKPEVFRRAFTHNTCDWLLLVCRKLQKNTVFCCNYHRKILNTKSTFPIMSSKTWF